MKAATSYGPDKDEEAEEQNDNLRFLAISSDDENDLQKIKSI